MLCLITKTRMKCISNRVILFILIIEILLSYLIFSFCCYHSSFFLSFQVQNINLGKKYVVAAEAAFKSKTGRQGAAVGGTRIPSPCKLKFRVTDIYRDWNSFDISSISLTLLLPFKLWFKVIVVHEHYTYIVCKCFYFSTSHQHWFCKWPLYYFWSRPL